jgi:hypothetical protein
LISGWLEQIKDGTPETRSTLVYHLKNGSEQPIYDLAVKVDAGTRGGFYRHIGTIAPRSLWELPIELPSYPKAFYPLEIGFSDSQNRHWTRATNGILSEVTEEEKGEFYSEHPGAFPSIEDHPTLRPENPRQVATRLE